MEDLENVLKNDLKRIKDTINDNRNKAMVIVNSAMILTYYEIGAIINERKVWGNKYIEKLSNELSDYGKGYSIRNLHYMMKISQEYSKKEIMQQPAAQIPWYSLVTITMKSKSHEEMLFYINETFKNGWSRSTLEVKMESKLYERSLINPVTSDAVKEDVSLKNIFKDTYIFDFLDVEKIKNEKTIKDEMIDNIVTFLQELGVGFAFLGREYKLVTPDNENYFIDLLLYNVKIHAYVVVEVKTRKFLPSDLGQLMFYVNAIDDMEKTKIDEPTIGIILCKDLNRYTAEVTLKNNNCNIGISKYKILEDLPKYLENKLNENK